MSVVDRRVYKDAKRKVVVQVTIPVNGNISDLGSLEDLDLRRFFVPANALGSYLAFKLGEGTDTLGLTTSPEDGTALTARCAAGKWTEVSQEMLPAVGTIALQLCSDDQGTPQVQSTAVTITLVGLGDRP